MVNNSATMINWSRAVDLAYEIARRDGEKQLVIAYRRHGAWHYGVCRCELRHVCIPHMYRNRYGPQ